MVLNVEQNDGTINNNNKQLYLYGFAEEPLVANVGQVYQQRQDNYE